MDCQQVRDWLHTYVDARVDAAQEREIERHIRACSFCRKRLVELGRAVNLLDDQRLIGPGPDFLRRVLQSVLRTDPAGAQD